MMTDNKVQPLEMVEVGSMVKLIDPLSSHEASRRVSYANFNPPEPEPESEVTTWIKENINKRVCTKFVRKAEKQPKDDHLCHCGYRQSGHSSQSIENGRNETEWKANKDTRTMPTDAFGEIEFGGFGQRTSKFVRADQSTDSEKLLQLMTEFWGMQQPNLYISVTGGAKNFTMRPRLKEVFNRGLMKAAESTGAWIITGGTNAGVMKHVGSAVRIHHVTKGNKNKIVAIGIASWGCISNKSQLINPQGCWPVQYREAEVPIRKESPLDPNHSHFILVDNGTQHQFGVEISLRAQIEATIGRMQTATGGKNVPGVIVVLEGGPNTLQTVKSAIQIGTPAVIVEGSGRAADILAYAYENSSEEEVKVHDKIGVEHTRVVPIFDNALWLEVEKRIEADFGTQDLDRRVEWVKDCLQKRNHMTVFRLDGADSSKDIDLAILQALLKVNKDHPLDQLRLALAWNRIDVAKSEIFTDDARWEPGELDEVMLTAILNDRPDFVKLFLENGVNLRDFLSIKRLLQLYNDIPKSALLSQLLKRKKKGKYGNRYVSLVDVARLIEDLTADFYQPLYLRFKRYINVNVRALLDPNYEPGENESSKSSLKSASSIASSLDGMDGSDEPGHHSHAFEEPARELFLWSILMGYGDLALLFWEEGKEGIAAALTAQMFLKNMQAMTDDTDLMRELSHMASKFERISLDMLSQCHSADERKTTLLLVRETPNFGMATVIMLAVEAGNKEFIAHPACQSLFNSIWRGKIAMDNGYPKMWFCALCPILILPLIKFRDFRTTHNLQPLDSSSKKSTAAKMTYVAFLLLYSIIILTDYHENLSILEIILIVWVASFFMEELRQLFGDESSVFRLKLKSYIFDFWNIMDVITILTFILGIVLKLIPDCADCFKASRIILALNVMVFYFRILHIFSVHKELGPKLVMIGKMIVDLCFFVIILFVFILAYGVASQAILYPNNPLRWLLIKDVMHMSYYQIYGELFLENIEGEADCTNDRNLWVNGTIPRCPDDTGTWVVPILLGVYILITNVLMLNLLIAMFSNTFNAVQENTDMHWCFQRYTMTKEYYDRPVLAPPFVIISHIYLLLKTFLKHCCKCCHNNKFCKWLLIEENAFRRHFAESDVKQLNIWENQNLSEYVRSQKANELITLENRVRETNERVDGISHKIEEIAETSFLMQSANSNAESKLPPALEDRLSYLEQQMQRVSKGMDWMITAMAQKGGPKAPDLPDIDTMRNEAKMRREAVKEEKKEAFKAMLQRQLDLHVKSRTQRYPAQTAKATIFRFNVPDDKVEWQEKWEEYEPYLFTDQNILDMPSYADPDILAMQSSERNILSFNSIDKKYKVDRTSYLGEYKMSDGLPLNPKGRTGLIGRGVLGRWGPNHAGDPIVTRWMKDEKGLIVSEGGKKVLEFVSIQRSDTKDWAIPGGLLSEGQDVYQCLKAEFAEEALDNFEGEEKKGELWRDLNFLFTNGTDVYKGYSDDPRNTDNAWIETRAVNYHDDSGLILMHFNLRAGDTVDLVRWQKVTSRQTLYGTHGNILQKVAELHNAAF